VPAINLPGDAACRRALRAEPASLEVWPLQAQPRDGVAGVGWALCLKETDAEDDQ
jgi:hypothetical protein